MNITNYPPNIAIYQIFYDEESKKKIDPQFIGLDNTKNSRPDWFEFWPIINFLNTNNLNEDTWYGFLSPNFSSKTVFTADYVFELLNHFHSQADVALFSHSWDQLAYYLNPFEHGEAWHPGLMDATQKFVNFCNLGIDLKTLVTYNMNSVFSNYIIAKPVFWRQWLAIANKFFEYADSDFSGLNQLTTSYGSKEHPVSMKTFIQERLSTLILSHSSFRVVAPNTSNLSPPNSIIFNVNEDTRLLLQTLDLLKKNYCNSKDQDYLNTFYKIRNGIGYIEPMTAFGHK